MALAKTPIRPTEHQVIIMLKIFLGADDEKVAGADVSYFDSFKESEREKLTTARDSAVKMGLIKYDGEAETASLTDIGKEILRTNEYVTDTDELTDSAKEVLKSHGIISEKFSLLKKLNKS